MCNDVTSEAMTKAHFYWVFAGEIIVLIVFKYKRRTSDIMATGEFFC